MFELLDLHFLGEEQLFCTYLLDLEDGLALVDPGPWTTLSTLESGLAELGVSFAELRHLLITHIHFDHAGACGALVAANPLLRVHVSERGAPHLVRPERLERSARRLYGDMFDVLWGRVQPVPAENIRVAGDRVAGLDCFAAPGHAAAKGGSKLESGFPIQPELDGKSRENRLRTIETLVKKGIGNFGWCGH